MVEINDSDSTSLTAAAPTRDRIAGLGAARYEIDELEPLVLSPKRAGLAHEHSRFRYRNRPRPHLRNVRYWRLLRLSRPLRRFVEGAECRLGELVENPQQRLQGGIGLPPAMLPLAQGRHGDVERFGDSTGRLGGL